MKSLILSLPILLFAGCGELLDFGGMRGDYPAKDHDPKLTEIARKAGPIFSAVEEYYEQNSTYPDSLSDIEELLPAEGIERSIGGEVFRFREWMYIREPDGFRLYYVLGWDPRLFYDSRDDTWTFAPGDGSPEKAIILDPLGNSEPGEGGNSE